MYEGIKRIPAVDKAMYYIRLDLNLLTRDLRELSRMTLNLDPALDQVRETVRGGRDKIVALLDDEERARIEALQVEGEKVIEEGGWRIKELDEKSRAALAAVRDYLDKGEAEGRSVHIKLEMRGEDGLCGGRKYLPFEYQTADDRVVLAKLQSALQEAEGNGHIPLATGVPIWTSAGCSTSQYFHADLTCLFWAALFVIYSWLGISPSPPLEVLVPVEACGRYICLIRGSTLGDCHGNLGSDPEGAEVVWVPYGHYLEFGGWVIHQGRENTATTMNRAIHFYPGVGQLPMPPITMTFSCQTNHHN